MAVHLGHDIVHLIELVAGERLMVEVRHRGDEHDGRVAPAPRVVEPLRLERGPEAFGEGGPAGELRGDGLGVAPGPLALPWRARPQPGDTRVQPTIGDQVLVAQRIFVRFMRSPASRARTWGPLFFRSDKAAKAQVREGGGYHAGVCSGATGRRRPTPVGGSS